MVFVFDAPATARSEVGIHRTERFAQHEAARALGGDAGGFAGALALDFDHLRGMNEAELFGRHRDAADLALVDATVADFRLGAKKKPGSSASAASAAAAALG